jgi:hypothetical protein
MELYKEVK